MFKTDVPHRRCTAAIIALAAVRSAAISAIALGAAGTAAVAAAATAPAAPRFVLQAPLTGPGVIDLLNQTIEWYRGLTTEQRIATEPSDLVILSENRRTSREIIGLAFAIARLDAHLLAKASNRAPGAAAPAGSSPGLMHLQKKLTADAQSIEAELVDAQRQLPAARRKQRADLQSKISELYGERDLVNARLSVLDTMSQFMSTSGSLGATNGTLKAQIAAMANVLPGAAAPTAVPTAGAKPAAPETSAPYALRSGAADGGGLWDLAASVVRLSRKQRSIGAIDRSTVALQATFVSIRAPLIDHVKVLAARGDQLAAQADTADSAALSAMRGKLDALADEFKQTSALLIPLIKVTILCNQYRNNLASWRSAIHDQYRSALKALGVRVGVLLALLVIVFAAAEVWRRGVFRYARDARRRYQLLLLRKIALWSLVVVIIGFAFASELGSIATFAGLITAGVALAMQSVLVSIVGYFFLIGKYGVRVGDRVQIGDVTGEVIDIGLVRMYLMELGGHGLKGPTGRVVAFANSIVFQVSSGLFKQIPGVNIAWHEIELTLPANSDHAALKDRLLAAVNLVLQDYRAEIERQVREIQRTAASQSAGGMEPQIQLRFSAAAVEAIVRYPVHLPHAAEIDERVSRELMRAIAAPDTASGGPSVPQSPRSDRPA